MRTDMRRCVPDAQMRSRCADAFLMRGCVPDARMRSRSEARSSDPLLVKYYSMYCMMESKKLMDSMADLAKKACCPLLLIYNDADSIVNKAGCDELFAAWKHVRKTYHVVRGGPHGKVTVQLSEDMMRGWLMKIAER